MDFLICRTLIFVVRHSIYHCIYLIKNDFNWTVPARSYKIGVVGNNWLVG